MAYRSGTYVAFDGQGEPCPANSDYKYFNTLKMWQNQTVVILTLLIVTRKHMLLEIRVVTSH